MLSGDTSNCNQTSHNAIKDCNNSLWNGSAGIEIYYTKLWNTAITECDKTFKKRSDTQQRFLDDIHSHIEPMSNNCYEEICDYIESRQEHDSIEHIMYTNSTASVVN